MTTFSPAAQAVLDAYVDENCGDDPMPSEIHGIAAALRAAADQVVPKTSKPRSQLEYELGEWDARDDVREEILTIATELEAQP